MTLAVAGVVSTEIATRAEQGSSTCYGVLSQVTAKHEEKTPTRVHSLTDKQNSDKQNSPVSRPSSRSREITLPIRH